VPNDLPHWHVEGNQVRQETTLAPNGSGLITHWLVPYTIDDGPAKGTTHTISVDPRDFSEAHVRQMIIEDLNGVHRIASLNSRNA